MLALPTWQFPLQDEQITVKNYGHAFEWSTGKKECKKKSFGL